MPQSLLDEEMILDVLSAGLLMSPEEFDNITEYDDRFRYELIPWSRGRVANSACR